MRVLAAVDRGNPYAKVSRLLWVSLVKIGRHVERRRETGELAPSSSPGRIPRICKSAEERRALWEQLKKNPGRRWRGTASFGNGSAACVSA